MANRRATVRKMQRGELRELEQRIEDRLEQERFMASHADWAVLERAEFERYHAEKVDMLTHRGE